MYIWVKPDLKENYSPLHSKKQTQIIEQDKVLSSTGTRTPHTYAIDISNSKNMEYHYQLTLATSPAYKQLQAKYKTLRESQLLQKQ